MHAVEPGAHISLRAEPGFKGGDTVLNALIVDAGNRGSVAGKGVAESQASSEAAAIYL